MLSNTTYRIFAVAAIILGAGVFGGWTAFLTDQAQHTTNSNDGNGPSPRRYIALGVSAAICVPLFLSLVQSALMPKIFDTDKAEGTVTTPYTEFLIFSGLCILASISARKFLDTLSDKVLQDVRRSNQKSEKAVSAAESAEEKADVALDVVDDQAAEPRQELDPVEVQGIPSAAAAVELSALEKKTLKCLMNVTFRTATGIGRDISIPRAQVGDLLDSLASKGLVERVVSPNTGGPRWKITSLGVRVIR
jgi:hypothetical protein